MLNDITISEIRDIRSAFTKNLELVYKEYLKGNDISRFIRTIIIALKLYPKQVGYYDILSIQCGANRLNREIEEEHNVHSQEILFLFTELLTVQSWIFTKKSIEKRNLDNLSIESLVYDDGYYAKITDDTLSIIDYCGNDKNIVIPDKMKGLPVTAIDDYAFLSKNLTKVTFGSNIKSIGESAFFKNNIASIEFTDGINSIGNNAFHCNNLTALNLPSSVIYIGESAFEQNEIASLSLPNGAVLIDSGAFKENKLTSVIIPKGITKIGHRAFATNPLQKISISGNVELDWLDDRLFDDYYNKNGKREGVYIYIGADWVNENESPFKKWILKNLSLKKMLNDFELLRYEINTQRYGPTVAYSKSKPMMEMKRKISKNTDPIPDEVWGRMPEGLKNHIKAVIKKGDAIVTYSPKLLENANNSGGFNSLFSRRETISVFYGPLSSQVYDVESGECILMS